MDHAMNRAMDRAMDRIMDRLQFVTFVCRVVNLLFSFVVVSYVCLAKIDLQRYSRVVFKVIDDNKPNNPGSS